jgi:hypothetical protein
MIALYVFTVEETTVVKLLFSWWYHPLDRMPWIKVTEYVTISL